MRPRPSKPGAERIATEAVHGGPDFAELARLGLDPATILDFSTNVNPFHRPLGACGRFWPASRRTSTPTLGR